MLYFHWNTTFRTSTSFSVFNLRGWNFVVISPAYETSSLFLQHMKPRRYFTNIWNIFGYYVLTRYALFEVLTLTSAWFSFWCVPISLVKLRAAASQELFHFGVISPRWGYCIQRTSLISKSARENHNHEYYIRIDK